MMSNHAFPKMTKRC